MVINDGRRRSNDGRRHRMMITSPRGLIKLLAGGLLHAAAVAATSAEQQQAAAPTPAQLQAGDPARTAAAQNAAGTLASAWAATARGSAFLRPDQQQSESAEEDDRAGTPPQVVSIYSADWMLGDVPDMPNFTPLSPIDTSLPAYDEADLQAADILAANQAAPGQQGIVAWADGADPTWRFMRVKGTQLTSKDNDAPYYYIGTNFWYGMNLGSAGARGDRRRLLAELDSLQALGLTHVRVLAASEGPDTEPWRIAPALMPCPGKYNAEILDGFDFLMYALGQRQIRATVVLGNEWPWSGGFAQLVKWAELLRANGGTLPPVSQRGQQGFDQCGFPIAREAAGSGTFAAMKQAAEAVREFAPDATTGTQQAPKKQENRPAAAKPAAVAAADAAPSPQQQKRGASAASGRHLAQEMGAASAGALPPASGGTTDGRGEVPRRNASNSSAASGPSLANAFWRHRGLQKGGIPYPGPGQHSWSQWQDYAGLFYTSPLAQKLWADHVEFITSHVNPYTGVAHNRDPTIMAWQIANEPRMRHDGFAVRVNDLRAFIANASAIIKAAAPNQLVCTGMEGDTAWFSRGQATVLTQQNSKIDFVTAHVWPMNWKWYFPRIDDEEEEGRKRAVGMVRQYVRASVAEANALGKPLVMEEFGFARDGGSLNPNATTFARDAMYAAIFKEVIASANTLGVLAGAEFWAWAGAGRPDRYEDAPVDPEDICADPSADSVSFNGKPTKWSACFASEDARPDACPMKSWWSPPAATDVGGQSSWIGDPPHESQGWYSVYDTDTTTMELIFNTSQLLAQSQGCSWGAVGTTVTIEREFETAIGYISSPGAAACTAQLRPKEPRRMPPFCPEPDAAGGAALPRATKKKAKAVAAKLAAAVAKTNEAAAPASKPTAAATAAEAASAPAAA